MARSFPASVFERNIQMAEPKRKWGETRKNLKTTTAVNVANEKSFTKN